MNNSNAIKMIKLGIKQVLANKKGESDDNE